MPHDIFISYRRDGGEYLAGRVTDALKSRGFSVFMDVEDLKSGKFDEALLQEIELATDVLVILTAGALDRCRNADDWMRLEICHAMKCGRNVVPIFARGFDMGVAATLPAEVAELLKYNGLTPAPELFEASMDRLVSTFLQSKARAPRRRSNEADAPREAAAPPPWVPPTPRMTPASVAQPASVALPASAPPRKRWLPFALGGAALLLVVIAAVAFLGRSSGAGSQPAAGGGEAPIVDASSRAEPRREPAGNNFRDEKGSTQTDDDRDASLLAWIGEFLQAGEGPAVESLKPFYDDSVSPYFSVANASWEEIARDKQAYFERFPTIHYELVSWSHTPGAGGLEDVQLVMRYSAVRFDGKESRGVTHVHLIVHREAGRWKISGVNEIHE